MVRADEHERRKLYERMRRRYLLVRHPVHVGDWQLTIVGVADPEQVLTEMEQRIRASGRDDPRWQPYWARSWESASGLAEWLRRRSLPAPNVLDLGCGLGLAGIAAAAAGANVLFADAAHSALLFARYNAWPWRSQAAFRRLDWQREQLARQFKLILGADILYDPRDWPHLDRFWRRHLEPRGTVVLGEPGRGSAAHFPDWAQAQGWEVQSELQIIRARPQPIRLWQLQAS